MQNPDALPVRGYAQLPDVWAARGGGVAAAAASPSKSPQTSPSKRPRASGGRRSLAPLHARSPSPTRSSALLRTFSRSRSVSPTKGGGGPLAYSTHTGASPLASFTSSRASLDTDSFAEDATAGAPGGEEPHAVAERGWKPHYSLIDLDALGGPIAEALAEAQSRLKESWLMGPHLPGMRTAPFMKLLSAEHLEHLKQACVERQPLEISLDRYRTRRVKHGHASMLQLDAVFSSPTMLLFKEHWLSMLGDSVEDLEIRLYDKNLSNLHVPLGRVGAEWSEQIGELCWELNESAALPMTLTVPTLFVLEDVSAGTCSRLEMQGQPAQWEKDKRRPGWMSLLISDALNEIKPPTAHTWDSLRETTDSMRASFAETLESNRLSEASFSSAAGAPSGDGEDEEA